VAKQGPLRQPVRKGDNPKSRSEPSLGPEQPPRGVFEALLDDLNVGIANLSPAGIVLYCNARFRETLRIPGRREIIGTYLKFHLSPASWPAVLQGLKQAVHAPVEGDLRIDVNGRTRFVSLSLAPMCVSDVTTIRAMTSEKTELVETSKALDQSQAEVHSLSAKILQLRDNERRRIARDLHDVTGQELAVVLMSLGSISHLFQDQPTIRDRLKESVDILRKVEHEIRTLSYLLHPPLLDESGLAAALQWYVQGLEKRTGLHVHTELISPFPRLTHDREIALFRVVQESLTNVIRHADATNVWIRSVVHSSDLDIFVEDNGKGINPQKVSFAQHGHGGGVGIAGMHQRLRQIGGRLRVTSTNRGTVVCATAPITASTEEPLAHWPDVAPHAPAEAAPQASAAKRILIVDDHEITRRGIRSLLADEKDLEICGEASNGSDAIAEAFHLHPDLIILDLIMPQIGGLSVATHLRQAGLDSKILVFSTHSFPGIEKTVQAAGCEGYVFKQDASQELVHAVREVLHGSTYFQKNASATPDA
jgi:signal transduction histidine kinase/ActR/RegA family two-component response regulator